MKCLPPCLAFVLLVGCGPKEPPFGEIKIGMTYEEVEKLVGKPVSIERGVTELVAKTFTLPQNPKLSFSSAHPEAGLRAIRTRRRGVDSIYLANELAISELEVDTAALQPYLKDSIHIWFYEKQVDHVGALASVTWKFQQVRYDTFFAFFKRFEVKESTPPPRVGYFLNDREVPKRTWDAASAGVHDYLTRSNRITTYSRTDFGKYYLGEERVDRKYTKIVPSGRVKKDLVKIAPVKKRWTVKNVRAVVFDASSGRVIRTGYLPEMVSAG